MSKRFTDIKKWKNEWFTDLSLKAKLAWIYLCDECESHGVWKANYKLASYQLGFPLTQELLTEWFGDKLYFFDNDKILIVQFFEFQYGESKDTWSAKVGAKEKLERLGFTIENNKLIVPSGTHSVPTVGGLSRTVLIIGEGEVKGIVKGVLGGVGENLKDLPYFTAIKPIKAELVSAWLKEYPEDWLNKEITAAKLWCLANEHKKPKVTGKFLNGWFQRGWESHRKTIQSNKPGVFDFLNDEKETA